MGKVIPAILSVTIFVAGILAYLPIERASTIHSSIQSNSARLSEDLVSLIVPDTDLIIECPAASSGCHILEVFVEEAEAGGNDIDL